MAERIEKDQIEARQKLAVGSTSKLVPFSGRDKVGLKDIGGELSILVQKRFCNRENSR
jgi:hypothetical protein